LVVALTALAVPYIVVITARSSQIEGKRTVLDAMVVVVVLGVSLGVGVVDDLGLVSHLNLRKVSFSWYLE
jgi:hypothetical protein